MPRKPRYFLPNVPVHIVQRGHNREAVFFEKQDVLAYKQWLKEASLKYDCKVHAYCLMTNHIHLLASPATSDGISHMMQFIGRHYVPYINKKYGKSGSIWEGRYKSSLVDAESYLLACMRYIELNPVAANMVKHARLFRWSSYRCNAEGQQDDLVQPHDVYLRLGAGDTLFTAYRELFNAHQEQLSAVGLDIRLSTETGTPLGNDRFKAQIEQTLKQRVGQNRRGRPAGYVMSEESKKAIGRAISNAKAKQG